MPHKVIWDYTYYWGVLSQFFFQNRLTDLASLSKLRDELEQCKRLNLAVQQFLREWSSLSAKRNPAVMIDQASMDWFAELNRSLTDSLDEAAFRERLRQSHTQLRALARQLLNRASADHPALRTNAIHFLLAADSEAHAVESPLLHAA
jgi:biopolymer transport protein ExbB/TolQ